MLLSFIGSVSIPMELLCTGERVYCGFIKGSKIPISVKVARGKKLYGLKGLACRKDMRLEPLRNWKITVGEDFGIVLAIVLWWGQETGGCIKLPFPVS